MSKEMMMADRPQGGDGPSIGNYKGVMLCNRPFAGTAVAAKAMANSGGGGGGEGNKDGPLPFRCGIQKEVIGLNPTKKLKYSHPLKKKNNALSNHKRWLRDLSRTKEELREQHLMEIRESAERRKRFLEKEKEMRAAILETIKGKSPEPDEEVPETELNKEIAELVDEVNGKNEESKEESKSNLTFSLAQKKKVERKSKPAWAYSEGKYAEVEEDKKEDEVEDLLSFAENLDFEQYVADYEVRAALEKVRDRIAELSRHKVVSEGKEEDGSELVNLKLTEKALLEHEKKFAPGNDDNDDNKSIASALSETKSLRSIHSAKSLKAIINKLKDNQSSLPAISEKIVPPVIIQIDDDGGTRLTKKMDPSQLPYMHRNPAV